jgi:hypothetical protein
MTLTSREFWLIFHLAIGAFYLHSFATGLTGLVLGARLKKLNVGTWLMALTAWVAVISGTWIVYPWYRAATPKRASTLDAYPRSFLLADPQLAQWHLFGMEWKEHIGWLSPILATAVGYVVIKYGHQLSAQKDSIRRALMVLFALAFITALISGVLGALINKVAPNQFLDL